MSGRAVNEDDHTESDARLLNIIRIDPSLRGVPGPKAFGLLLYDLLWHKLGKSTLLPELASPLKYWHQESRVIRAGKLSELYWPGVRLDREDCPRNYASVSM